MPLVQRISSSVLAVDSVVSFSWGAAETRAKWRVQLQRILGTRLFASLVLAWSSNGPHEELHNNQSRSDFVIIYVVFNRSIGYEIYAVMPLDVLGRTRATLTEPASTSPWPKGLGNLVKLCRAGDRALQLLLFNEECLVSASHQLALTTSLPFDLSDLGGVLAKKDLDAI